jgi:superfamily II DNA or RNA helicase
LATTEDIWAHELRVGKNKVRQLLVRAATDLEVRTADDGGMEVHSAFGTWPARMARAADGDDTRLTAVLTSRDPVTWTGSQDLLAPEAVRASFDEAIAFTRFDRENSLRRPQLGALHAVIGHQMSGLAEPATVVMPTGTGKTETMLAWMVAEQPVRLLVVVPSTALRDQLASKFETLGVLQHLGIVSRSALRPCVGRLGGRLDDKEAVSLFVEATNVVVATVDAVHAIPERAREFFYEQFTHLIVDEAHHAPATTWAEIVRGFDGRPVVLFTATPFRNDGRPVPGRTVFRFPLREAQRDEYFSRIDFRSILDFDDDDEPIARAALRRLRSDLTDGWSHVLLARVKSRARAKDVHELYLDLAPDFNPTVLHTGLSGRERKAALRAIRSGESRVIVCVDMLGEGFDLPTLKVGAFHDPHKSLSPMIQLIGRLARTSADVPIGTASIFVRERVDGKLSPLRDLLREDPDWNTLLSDITERATEEAERIKEFEGSFTGVPFDVPVSLLEPKMSAIAFEAPVEEWDPQAARRLFKGGAILDELIATSADGDVAWFVIESVTDLRWGDVPTLQSANYSLVVMHLDRTNGLLYIHGSDTKRKYDDLASAVLGQEAAQPIKNYDTFRVFDDLERIIPTNIGLLDSRDRDRRFTMLVGSNVEEALHDAEAHHKTNTHIATKAVDNGKDVTICASVGGRFWSMRSAGNLAEWVAWCRAQGKKLRDGSIDVHSLFRTMIVPIAVTERPPHSFIAMEWPWRVYLGSSLQIRSGTQLFAITNTELHVDDNSEAGDLQFSVVLPDETAVPYEATFNQTGVHYRTKGARDLDVVGGRGQSAPLSAWLNDNKPTLFLAGDRMIDGGDRLLGPRDDLPPYPRDKLKAVDWVTAGVNIRVESQGAARDPRSIQAFMVKYLLRNQSFDVLIDDDGSGEAADLVGLRVDGKDLVITLVHCKYSGSDTPGGRLSDLYEVCGQAVRSARWRDKGAAALLAHLQRRAGMRHRAGRDVFEVGDREKLHDLQSRSQRLFPRLETLIVQPGLSIDRSTDEQLRLIAGAASYVNAVTKGGLHVYCSD